MDEKFLQNLARREKKKSGYFADRSVLPNFGTSKRLGAAGTKSETPRWARKVSTCAGSNGVHYLKRVMMRHAFADEYVRNFRVTHLFFFFLFLLLEPSNNIHYRHVIVLDSNELIVTSRWAEF